MIYLLAIESSCDETSAAIMQDDRVLSNIIATQKVHEQYGGVVPELASRAHQANIVPVVHEALRQAGISLHQLSAIAYTQGPGLMGSLHVGASFAKSLSMSLGIPLIPVHHMQAHILAHFIRPDEHSQVPSFPFLCLTVSGGHTQIVKVNSPWNMQLIGETIDDAAGEAFDKAAKVLGLPYPGGPVVDRLAQTGDSFKFHFPLPKIDAYNFSFSGLKTKLLYFLRDQIKQQPDFITQEMENICASYQYTLISYLIQQLEKAALDLNIDQLCLAGGVSANSELRNRFGEMCQRNGWKGFIPPFEYCTDNAAMIGIAGYFKYQQKQWGRLTDVPQTNWDLQ